MAERRIVWTHSAKIQLYQILEFFNERNQSKVYSLKLYRKINSEINTLLQQSKIGKKTDIINVRGLLIENYYVFYELKEDCILILNVWDTRQDPEKLDY
jgi:toxin YoeB